MVQLVLFINLFFAPVVCLYLLYRKKEKRIALSMELLFQYCIITACNIPAAKIFVFLLKKVAGVYIELDSGYYTLIALLSAVLLAWFVTNVQLEISIKKAGMEEKTEKADAEQLPQ